jgi:SWI/SNF-related matrix-associated actin-dependent regulator 1 of chromatin subfamily A
VLQLIESFVIQTLIKEKKEKVLLFHHHKVYGEAISELLENNGIRFFCINQSTSTQKRIEYQDAFQSQTGAQTVHTDSSSSEEEIPVKKEEYDVGLLSIKAAGAGLTLTAANNVVFTELLFGPDDMLQAEDRVHRIGQEKSVNIFYCIQEQSTDDINWGMMHKKNKTARQIIEGESKSNLGAGRSKLADMIQIPDALPIDK